MTSAEAILQKLNENKDRKLEEILQISGSAAMSKNAFGINVVDEKNVATSLIFKSLTKDKYDEKELVKAVDVEVKELKPNIPEKVKDLVPKPLYDDEVKLNTDLRKQVTDLNNTVDTLNSQIADLKSQVQNEINTRLNIEQTNDVLVNQLETLNKTIEDFANQISISLQKSVDESILRASLQSQNTGFKAQINTLIKQIDSLNAIIEGLQSQIGAVQQQKAIEQSTQNLAIAGGGEVINEVVIAKFLPKNSNPNGATINVRIKNNTGLCRFQEDSGPESFGNRLELSNNDTVPVTVRITHQPPQNQNFLIISETLFDLQPGVAKIIRFKENVSGCTYGKRDHSVEYQGTLNVSVKRSDGSEKNKSYKTQVQIMHPKSY